MSDLHAYLPPTSESIRSFLRTQGISARIIPLPGEVDYNFMAESPSQRYLIKVSRRGKDPQDLDFYTHLQAHLEEKNYPLPLHRKIEGVFPAYLDEEKQQLVQVFDWIDGRIWAAVNPKSDKLLEDLGKKAALLDLHLVGFDHSWAHRKITWDLGQSLWVEDHLDKQSNERKEIFKYFLELFKNKKESYRELRKAVIHNDINDHNILVNHDHDLSEVLSFIDFGDAIHSQLINNLAVALAYALMEKPDPLGAASGLVRAYHQVFPLWEEELKHLYALVGMRLLLSLTHSRIRKEKEPENSYLQVSEAPAWKLLQKWHQIPEVFAWATFRWACGKEAHPGEKSLREFAQRSPKKLRQMFPNLDIDRVLRVDMSIGSLWLGPRYEFTDDELKSFRLQRLQAKNPKALISGGYLERRAFYSTEAYKREGNQGPEYRSIHLGIDIWRPSGTAIHALWPGQIVSVYNNNLPKDYGPTLILKHQTHDGQPFYSLYGHLNKTTLTWWKAGDRVEEGAKIAELGAFQENGGWTPHLHFQLMLDLLENTHDFPGVAFPGEVDIWKSICPNPNLFFREEELNEQPSNRSREVLLEKRKRHLGYSLSLSYQKPLHVLRGEAVYLLDVDGRRYLDLVNNVAHCGHEHPRIVCAGQQQMALLNTNTRYLHENIIDFIKELLAQLPPQLSVVHMVNSGSEANDLALRMAFAYSKGKEIIGLESAYHGHTQLGIEVSSYKFDGKGGSGLPPSTHLLPLPDSFRAKQRGKNISPALVHDILEELERDGKKVAAFIAESMLSCGGQIPLPSNYLKTIYEAVREAGGICIADEVQVGVGRMGSHFWGFQSQEVVPDILTIGKPIGNGHPIGVVVSTEAVARAFANGMEYFNTFGGNPVSAAIAKEVLAVVKEEALQAHAMDMGRYIKGELLSLQKEFPILADIRGEGLFLGIELCGPNLEPRPEQALYLINRMRENGILMSTDGPDQNVLKVKPPMVIQPLHIEEWLERLRSILMEDKMKL